MEGLVCFENKLKGDTKETLERLARSNIESKMITGDSLYIAAETGRRAGILGLGEKVVFLEGKNCVKMEGEDLRVGVEGEDAGRNRMFQGIVIEPRRQSSTSLNEDG